MQEKWEQLTMVFAKMLAIYQELLALSKQKCDILVQSNVKELELLMEKEETLFFEVTKLDRTSKEISKELALPYGVTEEEAVLSKVLQLAEQEGVCELKNVRQELREVLLDIKEVNALNQKLVEQGLTIVNYSLNVLAQSSVGPTYHPNESKSFAPPQKALFDSKA